MVSKLRIIWKQTVVMVVEMKERRQVWWLILSGGVWCAVPYRWMVVRLFR